MGRYLRKYYRRVCVLCVFVWTVLELYVGYGPPLQTHSVPSFVENLSPTLSLPNTHLCSGSGVVVEPWLTHVQFMVLGGYASLVVYDGFALYVNAPNEDTRYIHIVVLLVNFMSFLTEVLIINNWGGVCLDKFGFASYASLWPLLFVFLPLLVHTAFGSHTKRTSRLERLTVVCIAAVVCVAFAANIKVYSEGMLKMLTAVAIVCAFMGLYSVGRNSQQLKARAQLEAAGRGGYSDGSGLHVDVSGASANVTDAEGVHLSSNTNTNHAQVLSYIRTVSQNVTKSSMSFVVVVLVPVAPIVYMCSTRGYLTHTVALALSDIGGFLIKVAASITLASTYTKTIAFWKDAVRQQEISQENRRAYLRSVFHDVRVPLNSVVMGMELIEGELRPDADRTVLGMMREASRFMTDTLNDVLSIEKCEAGQMELEFRPFDVHRLVDRVSGAVGIQCLEKGLTILVEKESNDPLVLVGDKFRLEHVVANLVSNAIKFSRQGTITIRVTVDHAEYEPPALLSPTESNGGSPPGDGAPTSRSDVVGVGSPSRNFSNSRTSPNKNLLLKGVSGLSHLLGDGDRLDTGRSGSSGSSGSTSGSSRSDQLQAQSENITASAPCKLQHSTSTSNCSFQDSQLQLDDADFENMELAEEAKPLFKKVTIEVSDQGPGIKKDDLPHLFKAFRQLKQGGADTGQGTGLGLSLCKQIVELHGGSIWCTSELGAGSTFGFAVPFRILQVRPKTPIQPSGPWTATGIGRGRERVVMGEGPHGSIGSASGLEEPQPVWTLNQSNLNEVSAKLQEPMMTRARGAGAGAGTKATASATESNQSSSCNSRNNSVDRAAATAGGGIAGAGMGSSTSSSMAELAAIQPHQSSSHNPQQSHQGHGHGGGNLGNSRAGSTASTSSSPPQQSPSMAEEPFFPFPLPQRVLVCDDSAPNRNILAKLLTNQSLECDKVEDGAQAVALVAQDLHKYGIIFMDRIMPNLNGLDATVQLRNMGFSNLIVGLTGASFDEEVVEFLDSGADAVFPKPLENNLLKSLVAHLKRVGHSSDGRTKWKFDGGKIVKYRGSRRGSSSSGGSGGSGRGGSVAGGSPRSPRGGLSARSADAAT